MTNTASQSVSLPFDDLKLSGVFDETESLTLLGVRGSALVETIVFLSIAVMLNIAFGDGMRFINMQLHPFGIIVLIVTVQYGLKEALAAALLSSVFLLAWNLPEQTMSESSYDYILRAFSHPLLWITAALVLGGIRERQTNERMELVESFRNLEEATSVIVDGYNALKDSKERLETRLSEERGSLVAVYNIAMSLETLDNASVLVTAEKLMRLALKPVKFSIFRISDGTLRLKAAYGWEENDRYAERFDSNSSIGNAIMSKKNFLSVASARDEKILGGEGQMAGPIYDQASGRLYGMIKIEEADFLNMNTRAHETFRIICSWIARAAHNVECYRSTTENVAKHSANDPSETIRARHNYREEQNAVPQSAA